MSGVISARAKFTGAVQALKKIHPRCIKATRPHIERAARLACISCAKSTVPYGTGEKARTMGENAVSRDIAKVYLTLSQIFGLIRAVKPKAANSFWRYVQAGDLKSARAVFITSVGSGDMTAIPWKSFDGGAAHKGAKKSRGRIPEKQKPLMVVTNLGALRAYVRKKVKLVGFAKAAWANAARSFGGIRGLRSEDEGDITAAWILRHKGALFRVQHGGSGSTEWISVTPLVDYAADTLTPQQRREAERIAIQRMKKQYIRALKYEAKKALQEARSHR